MRIIELKRSSKACIDAQLSQLASSDNLARALRGQHLLAFVRYFQTDADGFDVYGAVFGDELWLMPKSPTADRRRIVVHADWYDYGPIQEGRPVMHYRLRVRGSEGYLDEELRTRDFSEIEQFVKRAFQ
jgi:hypothetical protein